MSDNSLNIFTLLGFFALGIFTGLRWAATRRQVDDLSFRLVYTPGHDTPIPRPHIDQEYRA
jgi:hypothetical protein